MIRIISVIGLVLFSCLSMASENEPSYQIDMIVFIHQQANTKQNEILPPPLLAPDTVNAIALEPEIDNEQLPYHLLPKHDSILKQENWALNQRPQYQVLFQYTWIQPEDNQKTVSLPKTSNGIWEVEGTIMTKHNNYYHFNTDLLFSSLTNKQDSFIFSHSQRLKDDVAYYFDHPIAGMLIKIHKLS